MATALPEVIRRGVLPGAAAGLAGGLAFGGAMLDLGSLDSIASVVRADSRAVAIVVHMAIATLVGVGFGLLVWRQRLGVGETLFWGVAYGAFFWVIGPLTLRPVFTDNAIGWNIEATQRGFAALIGHLVYGITVGLVFVLARWCESSRATERTISRSTLARGALAGLFAVAMFGTTVGGTHGLVASWTAASGGAHGLAWAATLGLGLVAGLGYAMLYPSPLGAAGASVVRGIVFGFVLWVVGPLTLFPVFDGEGLDWSIEAGRASFTTFPAFLLFGVAVGALNHWLSRLGRLLFADDVRSFDREGAGTQGVRALGRGALAGLVGGVLFTLIMIQIDYLPRVAQLVGSDSIAAGVVIHLVIAELIGASYGVLFRRQSFDLGSAIGWGVAYGFCWWVLGTLTLLPTLLGGAVKWDPESAAAGFPALVGHLVYGAGLGLCFYYLETRHNPWWVTRTKAEAERREASREQILGSAPAVWALVILIAVTMPVVLGTRPGPSVTDGGPGPYGLREIPSEGGPDRIAFSEVLARR